MHDYYDNECDRGFSWWRILGQALFNIIIIICFLTVGAVCTIDILKLRARVEAIEEVLLQAETKIYQFEELQFPGEPTPALEKGGSC